MFCHEQSEKKSINMKRLTLVDIDIITFSLPGCQIIEPGEAVREVTLATSLEKCRHVMFDQGLGFQDVCLLSIKHQSQMINFMLH